MEIVTGVGIGVLGLAGVLCVVRLLRPGSLADRVVALDTLLLVAVSGIALQSLRSRSGAFLDLLVITALVGFTGTVIVARYVERRGA